MKSIEFNLLAIFIICLGIISCNQSRINIDSYDLYISQNFDQYKHVRKSLADTLNQWKEDSLACTSQIFFHDDWQVDSILLFNKDSTRLFTTINERNTYNIDSKSDKIEVIVGMKKYDKWHFHFGSNTFIPRSSYQNSIYSAMTFEEISYVSHTKIMARFLKINEEGQCFIDFDEMDNYFYKAYKSNYPDLDKIDSLILSRISDYKKKKLDVKMIKRVKEKRLTTIKPTEPKPNTNSWRNRLFGKSEVKLFETEEWKNRRK